MQYYIKDNFYFDVDQFNQFRLTGVENHLLLGLPFPADNKVEVKEYDVVKGQLHVRLQLSASQLEFPFPLVTDIRTLRSLTESVNPRPTYDQLLKNHPELVKPQLIKLLESEENYFVRFLNRYQDGEGSSKKYGSEIVLPKSVSVKLTDTTVSLKADQPLELVIRSITNIRVKTKLKTKKIFQPNPYDMSKFFIPNLLKLYQEAGEHIAHLIKAQKTSSFEYGTIFPRDWIESADLGRFDFTQDTIDYLYAQSMKYISEDGQGWHEDVTGAYKSKVPHTQHIDRKMIDIEPRYIMGLRRVSKQFLTHSDNQKKLQLVAQYVLKNAENFELISFKKKTGQEEYEMVGNWRDSYQAYPRQKSPLSPYDVNCVFYPVSLRIIRNFHQFFGITDLSKLDKIIEKWSHQKQKFRLYHHNDTIGYSLALHGTKNKPLPIPHLDEGYDLFYGSPSMEEIISFAEKLKNSAYFFTPAGPLLVAADEEEFTTQQYHGKVIWPKQAAFAVGGLTRQYFRGVKEAWPWPVLDTIKEAVIITCEASFRGWQELGAVPELYYYDSKLQRARLYTDQPRYEGQMSLIQLWSAVGCRRMMFDYVSLLKATSII